MRRATKLRIGLMAIVSIFLMLPLSVKLVSHQESRGSIQTELVPHVDSALEIGPSFAYADEAAPAPVEEGFFQAILKFITGNATEATGIILVAEILMRLVPTSRALSMLVPVSYMISTAMTALGLLKKLIDAMINIAQNKTG